MIMTMTIIIVVMVLVVVGKMPMKVAICYKKNSHLDSKLDWMQLKSFFTKHEKSIIAIIFREVHPKRFGIIMK
jgi:hypothetical protein